WECVEDAPPNPATGKRRQIKRRGKTRTEAKQRVEEILNSLQDAGIDYRVSTVMTFEKVAHTWLEVYAATGGKRGSIRIREEAVKLLNEKHTKEQNTEIAHYTI